MSFEIDPTNVSQADIKAALEEIVAGQPDSVKWSDFFASGAGQILLNLIASLGTLLTYNNIVGRREAYIQYAQNRSSVIAGASILGHSARRGHNARLQIKFIPTTTGTLPKWSLLGTVKDRDLILEEDTVVNSGIESTVTVTVGTIKTETLTSPTDQPHRFQFTTPNVSADIRLYLNGTEQSFTEKIVDLVSGKFVAQSNVFGSVDAVYLNLDTFATRYNVGSPLRLDWIELYNLTFKLEDVKWTSGTMTDLTVISQYESPEDIESIRINGPLANETQFVIRGREDYMKIVKQLIPTLTDVIGMDASAAIVKLFMVKPDGSLYTTTEKYDIQNTLSLYRPFGVMPPDISDPDIVFYNLNLTAKVGGVGNAEADINALIDAMQMKLGFEMDFDTLEHDINALGYIRISRVLNDADLWAANTTYRKGTLLLPTTGAAMAYRVNRVVYRSGVVEPTWPISDGATIIDNKIIWRAREKTPGNANYWVAGKDYKRPLEALDPNNPLFQKGPSGETVVPTGLIGTPATNASATFLGATFTATTAGVNGNLIALVFDNATDIDTVVGAWNAAHLTNQVGFMGLPGTTVLPGFTVQLTGGQDFTPVDLEFEVVGFVNRSNADTPATTAAGIYGGVTFTAVTAGSAGNLISLNFNGADSIAAIKTAWNNGNPGNQVTSPSISDSIVPPAGNLTLSGGGDFASGEPLWPQTGPC